MPADFPNEPYLGLDDIEAHTTRLLGSKSSESMKSTAKRFYPGDVLYSRLRPYLNKVWLADRTGLCSSEFIVIPSNADVDGAFLKYRLNAMDFVSFANSLNAGDRPRVDFDQIGVFHLPPFSLQYQKRIVAKIEELFSELEAGEASLRKARRQLGVYRQSLLKQAFEGKLTQKWRTQNPDKLESPASLLARIQSERDSRHEQLLQEWTTAVKEWESAETEEKRPPKPQKLTPISESIAVFDTTLPKSWASLNLSQFVLELGQGWSPKCENREAQGDEWSVIKTTAIQFSNFDPSANKALPKHLPPRRWLGLRTGEILITRAGPRSRCGVVCRVRGDHPRLMICDKAYRLVLFEGATRSEFVELLLCSPAATAAIEKLKTGINDSGVNITQNAFLQLALPIPPLPEQQEIVRILDEQFEAIERNERELDAALQRSEALRQSILKKAFSGRLVPQDPADESASALLARLRTERAAAPTISKSR
jgi:type I restriction enzyme S subunit